MMNDEWWYGAVQATVNSGNSAGFGMWALLHPGVHDQRLSIYEYMINNGFLYPLYSNFYLFILFIIADFPARQKILPFSFT